MDTLVSKSTFYDTVSMIVPGFITLFLTSMMLNFEYIFFDSKVAIPFYLCFFSFSYLIGLLIHNYSKKKYDSITNNVKVDAPKARQVCDKEVGDSDINHYYKAYYKTSRVTPVPTMEAQVSFVRSMLTVTPILICVAIIATFYHIILIVFPKMKEWVLSLSPYEDINVVLATVSPLVLIALCIIIRPQLKELMIDIQEAIYKRVYEDSYYIDESEGTK